MRGRGVFKGMGSGGLVAIAVPVLVALKPAQLLEMLISCERTCVTEVLINVRPMSAQFYLGPAYLMTSLPSYV